MGTVTAKDKALYLACVDHITRLERDLEKLKSMNFHGPKLQKLDELDSILSEVSNFIQTHATSEQYAAAKQEIDPIEDKLARLRELMKSKSWNPLKSFVGSKNDDVLDFDIKMTYESIHADFMHFFVLHLVSCVKTFEVENHQKKAFLDSIDAFSAEALPSVKTPVCKWWSSQHWH